MIRSETRDMALEQNKKNQTAFVITGHIAKVEIDETVSFRVDSQVVTKGIFNDSLRVIDKSTARFYELPQHISHKILQNLNRRVKITIELTDDEDFI